MSDLPKSQTRSSTGAEQLYAKSLQEMRTSIRDALQNSQEIVLKYVDIIILDSIDIRAVSTNASKEIDRLTAILDQYSIPHKANPEQC